MPDLRASILAATEEGVGEPARFVLVGRSPEQTEAAAASIERDAAPVARIDQFRTPLEFAIITPGRVMGEDAKAFEAADAIAEAYDLATCEPEIFHQVMPVDPGRPSEREGLEGTGFPLGCWAEEQEELKTKKRWAIAAIKADKAWAFATSRGRPSAGAGVVIAQPDTGVTGHPELRDIPFSFPKNLLGDGQTEEDPTDPMHAAGNPGHGTGTASVVVSRTALDVIGSAPAATLMPIRAIESVVRLSQVAVADAIDHAAARGAHVITMSLGGIWSFSLWTALSRAVAADMIVLAAAGNCVRTVVWPARFEECIAVAGVDSSNRPWMGTSRGSSVDISAPAQNVYRAYAQTNSVGQGQGTSFAVALTAGAAACWLAYHGRAQLIAEARRRNETLQAMFRRLLKATAFRPASDWDEFNMGPGVVDVDLLLKADLDLGRETEAPVAPRRPPGPQHSVENLAIETLGDRAAGRSVDWVRHGGEISLALLREAATAGAGLEAAAAPIPGLRPSVAAALGLPSAAPAAPAVRIAPEIGDARALDKVLRQRAIIAARQHVVDGGTLESARNLESAGGLDLSLAQADAVMTRVMELATALPKREIGDPQAFAAALDILNRYAPKALAKLAGVGPGASPTMSRSENAALEAIIVADGSRPSFLLAGGKPPLRHPFMGSWEGPIAATESAIGRIASAVGRIQPANGHNGRFIGTGSLLDRDQGLVLTNFHVLDDAQTRWGVQMRDLGGGNVKVLGALEIDFIGEADSFDSNRFKVVGAKRHGTSGRGFGRLDAVTLRIEPLNSASAMPGDVVRFDRRAQTFMQASGSDLCTIGFPGPPEIDSDPSGRVDWNFVVRTLFGDLFGVKRLAPGRVIRQPGDVGKDPLGIVFGHDATTFGGASGSLVCAWKAQDQPSVGLHFGGDTEISNYAIAIAKAADELASIGAPV